MKIAIAGAGIAGAYLYRRLPRKHSIDVFDSRPGTECGLTPCAWGTTTGFDQFIASCGLDPGQYIEQRPPHVLVDEMRIKADLMTFDKPRLIRDLLSGAEIKYTPLNPALYDRVIDATGTSRAFLPPIEDDVRISCIQYLVQTEQPLENRISFGGIGYAWCFPLAHGLYHIGCGNLKESPHRRLTSLDWLSAAFPKKLRCGCSGEVRLTAPHYSQPFVSSGPNQSVWGIGEAIGCVSPIAGDGVIPGLKSVEILLHHWENAEGYTKAILAEFDWMRRERMVVDKLRDGKRLGSGDAWVLKKNSRRTGMHLSIRQAIRILRSLQQEPHHA